MRPCSRVGVDITWKCQWQCSTCFYLREPNFHKAVDVPIQGVLDKIDKAKAGGLDHVVFVGFGEPSLCQNTETIINYAHTQGMATSMITNGATGLQRFQGYHAQGMDHLHISSHGLASTLDTIAQSPGAFAKQAELKTWMQSVGWPFRTNVTLQQLNYQELPELAAYECQHGVYHFVFLGFLPHYGWAHHVRDVAVHPAELRPYIEDAAEVLLANNTLFTIRYHPFCHLAPKYWKYVVNARYVVWDPWEWNYRLQCTNLDDIRTESHVCGESVAIQGEPCNSCLMRRHCGGWNRVYAAGFDGAGLVAIRNVPEEYTDVWEQDGGLHDLNPANQLTGTIAVRPA